MLYGSAADWRLIEGTIGRVIPPRCKMNIQT